LNELHLIFPFCYLQYPSYLTQQLLEADEEYRDVQPSPIGRPHRRHVSPLLQWLIRLHLISMVCFRHSSNFATTSPLALIGILVDC